MGYSDNNIAKALKLKKYSGWKQSGEASERDAIEMIYTMALNPPPVRYWAPIRRYRDVYLSDGSSTRTIVTTQYSSRPTFEFREEHPEDTAWGYGIKSVVISGVDPSLTEITRYEWSNP